MTANAALESSTPSATYEHLLAFDPGPSTGVALFEQGLLSYTATVDDKTPGVGAWRDPFAWQFMRLQSFFVLQRRKSARTLILIESYHTVMAQTREAYQTVQLIGWLRGNAVRYGYAVETPMPSVKHPFLAEARITFERSTRRYPGTDHARDAVAHGLAYLSRHPFTEEPSA